MEKPTTLLPCPRPECSDVKPVFHAGKVQCPRCWFSAPLAAWQSQDDVPLCPVHQRLNETAHLEMQIGGNNCVACSLNERKELLDMLAPFAAKDGSEDSLTVMRRLADFYNVHVDENRVVVSYPAPKAERGEQ